MNSFSVLNNSTHIDFSVVLIIKKGEHPTFRSKHLVFFNKTLLILNCRNYDKGCELIVYFFSALNSTANFFRNPLHVKCILTKLWRKYLFH